MLTANAVISSTSGNLTLTGGTGVTHTAAGDLTTGGAGTISVTATANDITMADGAVYTAGSGNVTLTAANNVALGEITTTSSAINVTATAGAITDNTAAETANLTTTGTATLAAATGIGSAGGADDIDTTLGTLVATNNTSGNINVQETSGLIIGGTGVRTLGGNGNINIDVTAGTLDVNSVVTAHGSGNAVLNSAGLLTANAVISSTSGNINLTATGLTNLSTITGPGSVTIDALTGVLTNSGTISNGGGASTVTLKADGMALTGAITGGSGAVKLLASSDSRAVNIGTAVGGLDLTQAELNTVTTTGGLAVGGSSTHTAAVTVGSAITSPTGVTGGGFTLTNGGDVAVNSSVTYNANHLTGNNLTVNSDNGNITDNGSGMLDTAVAGAGDVVLVAKHNIGALANPIHIGGNVHALSTTSTAAGDIHISKIGALDIAGVNNPGGSVSYTATGNITQSGAIKVGTLTAKTLNNAGANIVLANAGNDVDYLDFRTRDAADAANVQGQMTFFDSDGYTVLYAAGGGMNFSSNDFINMNAILTNGSSPLNIDAGDGDLVLSTTGNISISGPGKIKAKNITLTLANNVEFSGGDPANPNNPSYNPNQNNDLLVEAANNISINADNFAVRGGVTTGKSGQSLKNDAIIKAGGTLKIETAGDFEVTGGTVGFAPGATDATAQSNAFITANVLDLKVAGDMLIAGGTVTHTGAGSNPTGNASAIIQAVNGKKVEIDGTLTIRGGTVDDGNKKSTAFAVLDPISTMNLKVGKNLIMQGGSGPGVVSASIVNSGEIFLDVGSDPLTPATVTIGGQTYPKGIILIGGKGSGRFDFNNNPLTENAYPITWTLQNGGAFTIDTMAPAGTGDAYIQSLAPRAVDSSLYGYLMSTLEHDHERHTVEPVDQGNYKRVEAKTSCN